MHQLDRGDAPPCLAHYRHGRDNWGSLTAKDKAEIGETLAAMQGARCAYCEAEIVPGRGHIEHFVQKGRDPRVTFRWDNLFGSCNRRESCGKHKDSDAGPYADAYIIKPDDDDPDEYLIFVSDGTIQPREGLSDAQLQKAEETLRVFNLDARHGALRQMRRNATAGYLQIAEALWSSIEDFTDDEWQQLFDDELAAIANLPFVTAIRHTLCRMV